MSKESEEIKNIVVIHFGALGFLNPSENEQILKDRDKVLNALQRLEAIDNAEPSEALECLHTIAFNTQFIAGMNFGNELITIKQALLKAQEQEKVLKIINEKCVDMFNLKIALLQNSVDVYNSSIPIEYEGNKLTQEEFELLKQYFEKNIQK